MVSFFVFEKKSCFFAKQKTIFLISGISLFVNGILQLIGPPICGFVFQMIGSYKSLFTVRLIVLILSHTVQHQIKTLLSTGIRFDITKWFKFMGLYAIHQS
jgi:hypothetical protein